MVESGPRGDARVVEYAYIYQVSQEWIEERVDIEGIELPREWTIAFALSDLPDPNTRSRARRLHKQYLEIGRVPELESPTDDVLEFLDQLEQWLAVETEQLDQDRHRRHQEELDREIAAKAFDADMTGWIELRGSERMKIARRRGYKVTGSYARARAREELPGCWVDTSDRAEYRERVDPSANALRVESGFEDWLMANELNLRTRIVWLTSPPSGLAERYEGVDVGDVLSGDVEEWEFEQQEAVLISRYLGRYDAYLIVNSDLRAPATADGEED